MTRRTLLVTTATVLSPFVGLACFEARANQGGGAQAPAIRQNDDQVTSQDGRVGSVSESVEAAAQDAQVAAASSAAEQARQGALTQPPESLRAMVYVGLPDPDVPSTIRAQPVTLGDLPREPGQPWRLKGKLVEVVNHGVLVDRDDATGKLIGVPMGNAETSAPDGFEFLPRSGGELISENVAHDGADNSRIREAARFGEVNAYYYADKTIALANGLLAELGEQPLPFLRVIVNAHSGSELPGYLQGDGEVRNGKLRPFPGGHYRLPTTLRVEGAYSHPPAEMNPTGEVHLGPGRAYITDSKDRDIVVDGRKYVRNASHVPGIITHETGHHVNGHTADFMANRSRKPIEYVNLKLHMDEGTADYWAAVVLDTPDIYNWQHAAEGKDDRDNRDLRGTRTTDDYEQGGDPHRNGNIWASALWDVRKALGAHETDLLVMKWLVLCGRIGPEGSTDAAIQQQLAQKDELRDGLSILLRADEILYQAKNRARLLKIFDNRGIDLKTPDKKFNRD
jgi:hypothetical protein